MSSSDPHVPPSPDPVPTASAGPDTLQQALGVLAHDLNNLLGLIANHAQLLRFVADDPDKVRQTAARIVETSLRGAELAQRLNALREPGDAARG